MSCGRQALKEAGIPVAKYFASEIDKHAIKVGQKNHPDNIQVGDVTQLKTEDNLLIVNDGQNAYPIDLIIGGSPCQGFSFAGKQLAFDDPRSALFFEFVRLVRELKPKYVLLENVKMKAEFLDIITASLEEALEQPFNMTFINSAKVSAQNRQRYYWTNFPVSQPDDRGIMLRDILEGDTVTRAEFDISKEQLLTDFQNHNPRIKDLTINDDGVRPHRGDESKSGVMELGRVLFNDAEKAPTLTTAHVAKVFSIPVNYSSSGRGNGKVEARGTINPEKAQTLTATGFSNRSLTEVAETVAQIDSKSQMFQINPDKSAGGKQPHMQNRVYSIVGKSPALTREFASRLNVGESMVTYRKLTTVECSRLQGLSDTYCDHPEVSKSQVYKMLGNGWTVPVITHIFNELKKHIKE